MSCMFLLFDSYLSGEACVTHVGFSITKSLPSKSLFFIFIVKSEKYSILCNSFFNLSILSLLSGIAFLKKTLRTKQRQPEENNY